MRSRRWPSQEPTSALPRGRSVRVSWRGPLVLVCDRPLRGPARLLVCDRPLRGPAQFLVCDRPLRGPARLLVCDRPLRGPAQFLVCDRPLRGPARLLTLGSLLALAGAFIPACSHHSTADPCAESGGKST